MGGWGGLRKRTLGVPLLLISHMIASQPAHWAPMNILMAGFLSVGHPASAFSLSR